MSDARPVVVARTTGTTGGELVLRRHGDAWEVVANGVFLMDTRDGRSERLLVAAALELATTHDHLVLGGLGLGTSLQQAVADDRVRRITVLEHEPTLLRWHRRHLGHLTGRLLDDPRVDVVLTDAVAWLRDDGDDLDVLCLDVDNGPGWLVTPANAWLYSAEGIAHCVRRLRPGGVLAHWSAAPSAPLVTAMSAHLDVVTQHEVEVAQAVPDVVVVGRRDR